MDLVILAAGMGSRFGGLKQLEPIDNNGNFIIDYSIYDAIKSGFDRVVFIIKEENYELFRQTVGKRVEKQIETVYVFQKNDNLPSNANIPADRVKPLGTGHALLCCKDVVKDNFAIISADDFYGYDAFRVLAESLKNNKKEDEYSVVGYKLAETLPQADKIKRGVCMEKDGYLTDVIESVVERADNHKLKVSPLSGAPSFLVEYDHPVSMIMFGHTPKFFKYLEEEFIKFFDKEQDLYTCEFLVPDVLSYLIKSNKVKIKVLNTSAVWHGITYKEDKQLMVEEISKLIDSGVYPANLWA